MSSFVNKENKEVHNETIWEWACALSVKLSNLKIHVPAKSNDRGAFVQVS